PRGDRVQLLDLQALLIDVKVTPGARRPSGRALSVARAAHGHRRIRSAWPRHTLDPGPAELHQIRRPERDRVAPGEARGAVAGPRTRPAGARVGADRGHHAVVREVRERIA